MEPAPNRKRKAKADAKLRKKQDGIAVGKKEKVVVSARVFKLTKKIYESMALPKDAADISDESGNTSSDEENEAIQLVRADDLPLLDDKNHRSDGGEPPLELCIDQDAIQLDHKQVDGSDLQS